MDLRSIGRGHTVPYVVSCSDCGATIAGSNDIQPLCLICRAVSLAIQFQLRRTEDSRPQTDSRERGWLKVIAKSA